MEQITIPKHVFNQMVESIEMASRILESHKRESAADRQIEYTTRLIKWIEEGQQGDIPKWLPKRN